MKYVAILVVSVALAGCVGKPVQEMSYSERQALAGQLVKRCMEQGVKLKTPEMEACTKQEALREVTIRNKADADRRSAVVCNSFGATVVCN
ncbi:hypothetical protein [Agrobacterium tumefaciens]|uniref:hypothetical protein n=1 Tax=Agrobacterium tumefaciens TaxID=358 RepID=UPI0015746481|nr:hypothetical protein [Agrobacterium tumefaciens]NTB01068.1 hypothetical protein [Agrobacterium tumefaciens]